MLLSEWAKELGVDHKTIVNRLKKGWSLDDALFVSPTPRNKVSARTLVILDALRSGMHPRDAAVHYQTTTQYMYDLCGTYHISFEKRTHKRDEDIVRRRGAPTLATIRARIKRGWPKNEAETVAPWQGRRFWLELVKKEFPE